jgi:hypothetical protein
MPAHITKASVLLHKGMNYSQCFSRDRLVILDCKQNMMSLRGQGSWAKKLSLVGKLTALACHLTEYVSKAE